MIVVDVNVLIYAYGADFEQHSKARVWVERAFSSEESLGIPWAVIHAFMRLMTKGKFLANPLTIHEAISIVNEWFGSGTAVLLEPGPRYWEVLQQLLIAIDARGDLVADAHIAALAVEHQAAVCTVDHDFQRFPGVRVINPLA